MEFHHRHLLADAVARGDLDAMFGRIAAHIVGDVRGTPFMRDMVRIGRVAVGATDRAAARRSDRKGATYRQMSKIPGPRLSHVAFGNLF